MQILNIGNVYNGFQLLEEKKINEVNSIARLFYHNKSGAKLFHLENDDNNKVFSISFRTPPTDNTGLPHILEHAVLCGSKKFPLKDPFIELAKGSLNTYLNAMTFSDKTMYPIASQNDKDFVNLMDVYLDAVLHPNIYNGPESFMQEGWHYELNSQDDPLSIKGVVYNEMKGAFSSPEQVLFRKVEESLFPDTVYRFESGGDPESIPELTYEQFLNFHKTYYHPSNSYIYLYGNGNLMEHLKFIDEKYLNQFDKIQIDSSISIQPSFNQSKEIEEVYSISEDENERNKTFISKNYVIGNSKDSEKVLAFNILNYLLLGSPAAPLKKALIEANIGKDVFGSFDSSIMQPTFSIVVKNSNVENKELFLKVVKDTLENLVVNGIDKKIIEAAINIHEFKLREADYGHRPKGLVYNIKAMNSWLYDEDPWLHLEYEKSLKNIKTALVTNYFERLIKEDILNNLHTSLLILKPKKGLASEKDQKEEKRLQEYKKQLSEDEVIKIVKQKENLEKYQNRIETDEALATIPLLSREDIKREVEDIPLIKFVEKDVNILHHSIFTNGITYVNLFFDTTSVPQELVPYTVLLSSLLGKVRTENHGYEELSNLININTGGIYAKVETYSFKYSHKEFLPKFVLRSSALTSNIKSLFVLLTELINSTKFDESNRIKEVIGETKSRLEMAIFDQGHVMAARRVNSYFSPIGQYIENTYGISYYMFISNLDSEFDEKQEEILENLKKVYNMIFNKNNMLISISSDKADFEIVREEAVSLIERLPNCKFEKYKYSFDFTPKNEGLLTSSKVQYVAKGYNFKELGYGYLGHMQVLKTIVSLDYLWNKVRVAGGAYGSLANFSKSGNLIFSSYRDPNLKETLHVYDDMSKYIEAFDADEREMRKYIIGTISNMDTPLSPFMKGDKATSYYISGITLDELQRERDEVLNTTVEDIRKYSALLTDSMKKNYLCVLGNERKIKESKEQFNNLVKVFL
ncbi:insulinase family protein [Alkaliphilus sp. B6464]|uniref:insulinase family protein n=1 Tax=Alkaliphilus sp. B6464 TaxID=2731219 RepID=UPI001BA493B9|nr:insulinase family protein [Alkaliphilus sp. B6464]QUH20326.1 insulinase family protein [Alkaliphilus sp. B6464]